MSTVSFTLKLSEKQATFLRQWGADQGLERDADISRAALRAYFGDALPSDPPAHGGSRGGWLDVGTEVQLKRAVVTGGKTYRAGTTGIVEDRTRGGYAVSFDKVVFVRRRDVEVLPGVS